MSWHLAQQWLILAAVAAYILFLAACAPPADRNDPTEDRILEERAREYFDERFRFYPVEATEAGLRAYDGELGQFAAGRIASRVLQLRDLRQRLLGIDLTRLSPAGFVDALWLTSSVKGELFELEELEPWRTSPRFYSDTLCRGVSSLLEPWGSPRVEALLSRLDQVPILLQAASENLQSVPPLAIEAGVADFEACQSTIAELPAALSGFLSDARAGEIQIATREAQQHIQEFILHLQTNVTPAGADSFRWGEDKLRVQLLYREMEETPLETIRLIAERQLSDTRESTRKLVAMLAASTATSAETDEPLELTLQDARDPTGDLVSATGELLETLRLVVSDSEMAGAVSDAPIPPVKVSRFVPPYAGALLETTGPLDPSGGAVLLLEPPTEPVAERPAGPPVPYELQVRAMREVYPGKYYRLLVERSQTGQSDLRRLLISLANREGWSLYAAGALLDETDASADPRLQLAELHHRLLEQTRLVAAILLHVGDLSLSAATQMFVNEAFLDPEAAEWEARRVALDPNRMSAALGALQIMKLRWDFQSTEKGEATPNEFYDAFLSCGELPIRLVRLLLLSGGEGRTLED